LALAGQDLSKHINVKVYFTFFFFQVYLYLFPSIFFLTFYNGLIEEPSFSDSLEESLFTFLHKLLAIINGFKGLFRVPHSSAKV